MKDEHGLRMFQNRALSEVFGYKREDEIGEWRKIHSD